MTTSEDRRVHWIVAISVAATQTGIAIFAVYASSQNRLSDGACLGGGFGTIANLAVLSVVVIWFIILAIKSSKDAAWHDGLKPLGVVALSSTISILMGLDVVAGCTV